MKKVYLSLVVFLFMGLASAVPQVFFSSVNLTMVNNSMHLWGEGLNAVDSFAMTYDNSTGCSLSYERLNIPLTFSRNMDSNETDVAVLINALNTKENMTFKWTECINYASELKVNLSVCQEDSSYKSNYTICNSNLVSCTSNANANANVLNDKQIKLDEVTQQRTILIVVSIILGIVSYTYYNKTNIKKVESPYSKFPSLAKM